MITPLPVEKFIAGQEGIFDIPEWLYHDHKKCPEINRGLVVEMLYTTPAHVKALMDGLVPKRKPTQAMEIGTLFDKALLEPDRFREGKSHWVRPAGLNLTTKMGRQWMTDHPGLPVLRHEEAQDIQAMIEAVMKHSLARRIVEEGSKQESAFCRDPDTGLLRKVRADSRLAENSGRLVIADLKSTFRGCAAAPIWSNHCARQNYHVQDTFYGDVYHDLTGEDPFFIFLVVERKPPYAVRLFQLHEDGRRVARDTYKRALEQIAQCKASGLWPSYPEQIETIKLPSWALSPRDPIVHD